MIIERREIRLDIPAHHGKVTVAPEEDRSSATCAAQRHAIVIEQGGGEIRLLERGEVAELIGALHRAMGLFPAQREASREPNADTPPRARAAMEAAGLWADGALAQNRATLAASRPLSSDVAARTFDGDYLA